MNIQEAFNEVSETLHDQHRMINQQAEVITNLAKRIKALEKRKTPKKEFGSPYTPRKSYLK